MQDVLEFVLKNLVTVPEEIKIDVEELEGGTTNYIITVNPVDVGRIIGKEGKVIKAIRTIMRVIAIQRGVHVRVSVVSQADPTRQMVTDQQPPQADQNVVVASSDDGLSVEV
mgnify:CR=1 FL=1